MCRAPVWFSGYSGQGLPIALRSTTLARHDPSPPNPIHSESQLARLLNLRAAPPMNGSNEARLGWRKAREPNVVTPASAVGEPFHECGHRQPAAQRGREEMWSQAATWAILAPGASSMEKQL